MTRLISGVVLAAAALAAIRFLPVPALRVLACGVAVLAGHEFARIAGATGTASRALVMAGAGAACWWVSTTVPAVALAALLIVLLAAAASVLALNAGPRGAALGAIAPAYLGMPLGMLVAVHAWRGWRATVLLVAAVVVSDSAQYYAGRLFGRRPLAPAISPKKTMEGAAGGVVLGTAFVVAAGPWALPGATPGPLALAGLGIVVLGICGDLFESRLKRNAGLKDSSSLIPGHGGVLDRIDALLFAILPFYFLLRNLP